MCGLAVSKYPLGLPENRTRPYRPLLWPVQPRVCESYLVSSGGGHPRATGAADQLGNRLVDCLPASERDAVMANSRDVRLGIGEVVAEAGQPLNNAYFPRNGLFSLVALVDDGSMVEAATIGNEGMLGIQIILGVDSSPNLRGIFYI